MTINRDKSKRLGRGLSGLLETQPVRIDSSEIRSPLSPLDRSTPEAAPATDENRELRLIEATSIRPNPFQPRRHFDPVALSELAQSIRHSGLMQPIIVRRASDSPTHFELVAGERRWRAAQVAGLHEIPVLVKDLSDSTSAEWALVENLQREDLNAIDRADALKGLADRFGLSHAQIAERIGLDRSSVANLIRLAELEPQIRDLIAANSLSAGHGKALLQMPPGMARVRLAERAAAEHWSVRKLESLAKSQPLTMEKGPRAASEMLSPEQAQRRDLERQLGEFLGTKVVLKVAGGGQRGQLVAEFYGLEHFDGLLARIGFKPR